MAIDEADQSESGQFEGTGESPSDPDGEPAEGATADRQSGRSETAVGEYTWADFKEEHGYDGSGGLGLSGGSSDFDAEQYLGFPAAETDEQVQQAASVGKHLGAIVDERTVSTIGDLDPQEVEAMDDLEVADVRAFDEDRFFTDEDGRTTIVNRYDLEKAVPMAKKKHFREEERYWVNKPYSFVIIFHSVKENEKKYYVVEPHLNNIEQELREFLTGKLRTAIKYSGDEVSVEGDEQQRRQVIDRETRRLMRRYGLFASDANGTGGSSGLLGTLLGVLGSDETEGPQELSGIEARPEPAVLEDDPRSLNEYQVEKLLYFLKRNFIGYERIDPIKYDINVEDISCDGYDSPVFVYHTDYEQIISNIHHGRESLDDFVVKLAQRSGKGISKRRPQVDATLPDGSRSQLTLGREVSDHGTNYTIRQFKDVPFTPIDLINWNTFSLDEMAFLWLCIENNKSLIFAGGTASGKTTSLNAVSLFIPSNTKIVSIEDTREVELPQRNWVASVTRPSFGEDDTGDVDEFDLLEAALRQRPDYIVMGEIRGEEGRTLFQVMSTGHTTYTTFHADSVGEVLKRFTTDPINVSKTMFTALDLVSIQTQTRVADEEGNSHKVRRNKKLTEINHYDAENDEINVQDVYQWQAETDDFIQMGDSNTLDDIKFDRGWGQGKLDRELFKREVVLAYLIKNDLNTYTQVAATFQAFINDQETILTLIANDALEDRLEDLREMESVQIDIDPKKEEMVPRPDPGEEITQLAQDILEQADNELLPDYEDRALTGLEGSMGGIEGEPEPEIPVDRGSADDFDFDRDEPEIDPDSDAFALGEDSADFEFDNRTADAAESSPDGPGWLSDEDATGLSDEDAQPFDGDDAASEPDTEADAATEDASGGEGVFESDDVDSLFEQEGSIFGDMAGEDVFTGVDDDGGDEGSVFGDAGTESESESESAADESVFEGDEETPADAPDEDTDADSTDADASEASDEDTDADSTDADASEASDEDTDADSTDEDAGEDGS